MESLKNSQLLNIYCTNCNNYYDEELIDIRDSRALIQVEIVGEEIILACPECGTDNYLYNLKISSK